MTSKRARTADGHIAGPDAYPLPPELSMGDDPMQDFAAADAFLKWLSGFAEDHYQLVAFAVDDSSDTTPIDPAYRPLWETAGKRLKQVAQMVDHHRAHVAQDAAAERIVQDTLRLCIEIQDGDCAGAHPDTIREWRATLSRAVLRATDLPESATKQLVWDESRGEFIAASDAVKLSDGTLTLSQLSKMSRPDGPIRYMRRPGRCRVHVADLTNVLKHRGRRIEPSDEAIEVVLKGIEARKQAATEAKEAGK